MLALRMGLVVTMLASAAACATGGSSSSGGGTITVVAAENFWGNLASQLGGPHVKVTSVISNPNADPHDYEPTAADARTFSKAKLVVLNGAGYDPWASKLLSSATDSSRLTLDVGEVVGAGTGNNPHRWYSPGDVRTVVDTLWEDYKTLDPKHSDEYDTLHDQLVKTGLKEYFELIAQIAGTYAGTPIGASESIVSPLAQSLGLQVLTPQRFINAISEGSEPSAADKTLADQQISSGAIKIFIYNSQNSTPDVQRLVSAAKAKGIPVVEVTETLSPAGASFQDWQVAQLKAIQAALAQAKR